MLAIESFINWCDNMLIAEEASAKENILLLSTVVAAMAVPTAAYIGYAVKKIKAQTQSEKKAAEDLRKKISEERKQKARKEYEAYRDKMNRAEASVKVDSNYKSKVNQISTADL
jgi:membrane-bound lytic murein transglycosylase B